MESAGRHTGTIEPHRAALGRGTSAGAFVAGSDPEESPAPGPASPACPGRGPDRTSPTRCRAISHSCQAVSASASSANTRSATSRSSSTRSRAASSRSSRRPTTDAIPAPPPTRQPNGPSMPRHAGIMPELRKPADQVRYDNGFSGLQVPEQSATHVRSPSRPPVDGGVEHSLSARPQFGVIPVRCCDCEV